MSREERTSWASRSYCSSLYLFQSWTSPTGQAGSVSALFLDSTWAANRSAIPGASKKPWR